MTAPPAPFRRSLALTLSETARMLALLLWPSRRRAASVYRLLSTHNLPGEAGLHVNLGWWRDARTVDEACEALALRLAGEAGLVAGDRVLDAGSGFGDAARLWVERLGAGRVVALNACREQVEVARARHRDPRIEHRVGSATAIPFPEARFDRVLALESAFHFDTRERFLAEAHRVLRPGGTLALADLCRATGPLGPRVRAAAWVGRAMWQVPRANWVTRDAVAAAMVRAGFHDARVESVRGEVFGPWKRRARERAAEPDAVARAHPLLRLAWRSRNDGFAAMDYVIAVGTRG